MYIHSQSYIDVHVGVAYKIDGNDSFEFEGHYSG